MAGFARHALVWLRDAAWPLLEAQCPSEGPARDVLRHWQQHALPLVVARQRAGADAGELSLGLAAPLRWGRLRLTFRLDDMQVERTGTFPALADVAHGAPWAARGLQLASRLEAQGVHVQVFGSFGWQQLSGLPCVLDTSDLDLRIEVDNFDQARAVTAELASAHLPLRLDGELVFSGGHALAWRELAALFEGRTRHVLCKRIDAVELLDAAAVMRLGRGAAGAAGAADGAVSARAAQGIGSACAACVEEGVGPACAAEGIGSACAAEGIGSACAA